MVYGMLKITMSSISNYYVTPVSSVFYPIHNLSDSESSSNPYLNISSADLGPNVCPTTLLYVIFGFPTFTQTTNVLYMKEYLTQIIELKTVKLTSCVVK